MKFIELSHSECWCTDCMPLY